ncbi:MAG: homoserine kinase [Thermoprotei archaeon]|nr:MAG: homoserine kinase [Thermoprotei archaeon]
MRKNTAVAAAKEFLKRTSEKAYVSLRIWKGIPVGKGLGSSGATAATVIGFYKVFKPNIDYNELIEIAAEGEKVAAGSTHPDNVSASILGGLVLTYQRKPLRAIRLPISVEPKMILIIPEISTIKEKTKMTRSLIPKQAPLEKVIRNLGRLAALISGFILGNLDLAGSGMFDDIIEPSRKPLIPVYFKLKEKLLKMNVNGVCVCGAGPSILVMVKQNYKKLDKVKEIIIHEYGKHGIRVNIMETSIAPKAQVVEP